MNNELINILKVVVRALGEGVCVNILLPIWYVLIQFKKYISDSDIN